MRGGGGSGMWWHSNCHRSIVADMGGIVDGMTGHCGCHDEHCDCHWGHFIYHGVIVPGIWALMAF